MFPDELPDALHGRARVLHQVFGPAVFLIDAVDHLFDCAAAPFRVIGRKRAVEVPAPQLPRDDIHMIPHPREFSFRVGEHLVGREPRIEHQLEFAGESLPAELPVAGGARHQFSFEILLILFQERGDRSGGGLQGVALRGLAREQEQALVVERDRPPILANRRFEDRSRRASQVFLRRGHNTRNLRQPGDAVGDVRLLGKGGLGEKEVNAVADAVVVNARVLLERARVLGQPEGPLEVVFEDFVIDLAVARQPGVIDPAREFLQSRAGVGGPALTRLSGEIVEQGIETMVAQSRRFEWPAAEMFLEVMLEEIVESCIGVLSARRAGGFGHERESRQDCEC